MALASDSAGVLYLMDNLGNITGVGGDLSALYLLDPKVDVLRRIQAIAPTVGFNSLPFYSDCENLTSNLVRSTPAGTANAVLDGTVNGGAILTSTGTTNGSACVVSIRDAVADPTMSGGVSGARLVSNSRTQPWATYVRAQLVATPAATGKMCVIANMLDGTNDNFLGGVGATSTTNWVFSVGGVGANTGVAFDLLVHDFLVINDGTDVKAYIDWVQVGISTAASGVLTGSGYPRWYDSNGSTGANVSHRTYRAAGAVVKATPAGISP